MREPHGIKEHTHKSNTNISKKSKKKRNKHGASFSFTIMHAQINRKRGSKIIKKNCKRREGMHRSNHCKRIPRRFEVQNLPLYILVALGETKTSDVNRGSGRKKAT
jgi:hypothetical protein